MRTRAFSSVSAGALRFTALALISLAMLGVALADETEPPGRVARLSYVQGAVSLEPAGSQDWVAAELNRPLTTSDGLWSDTPTSRAELDIGGAVVRVGSDTGFSFLNLDDNIAQMQVTAGTVSITVHELLENQTYEIDTPNVAVLLDQAGQYRVDVNEAGNTTVVRVSEGQAEASGGGQSIPIANQQMMTFAGSSAIPASLGAPDAFDDWTFERDREYEQAASQQYVPEDMPGTEDLDENGDWQNTPDYGYVWVPSAVAVGWAPYSYGHWAWVSPWGWTWVDDAPWGFAPFHYGGWARWRNSWCWVPGPRQERAKYSPALVAWVGGGAGVGGAAAAAGVNVGWFPLGPREVYVPGYRLGHYANSAVPGAVITVPQNVFASAQAVNTHRINVAVGQGTRLATTAAPPAFAPIRQRVLAAAPDMIVRKPPAALLNRVVVARMAPPALAAGVRVRVVGTPATQGGRGPERNRAQAEDRAQGVIKAPGSGSPRPPVAPMPSPPASGDTRSWAERARALEHSTLPPAQTREGPGQSRETAAQPRESSAQPREYNDETYRPPQQGAATQDRSNEAYRAPASGGAAVPRDDRPPGTLQHEPGQVEQEQGFTNSYGRPQVETRAPSAPVSQQAPATRFVAPPPPYAPVPAAPHPVQTPAQPPQHPPAANHPEEHPAPRPPSRTDLPH
jgi:FecR protein